MYYGFYDHVGGIWRLFNVMDVLLLALESFWYLNHRKWTIIHGDITIYISSNNSIKWLQYGFRCSFCNLQDKAIVISRLAQTLNVDDVRVFKRCKQAYGCFNIKSSIHWSWLYSSCCLCFDYMKQQQILNVFRRTHVAETWYPLRCCYLKAYCENRTQEVLFLISDWAPKGHLFSAGTIIVLQYYKV